MLHSRTFKYVIALQFLVYSTSEEKHLNNTFGTNLKQLILFLNLYSLASLLGVCRLDYMEIVLFPLYHTNVCSLN